MEQFFSGFLTIGHPHFILLMFLGVSFGLILGFLPGLNGGMGIALLLPFTYSMEPLDALVLLLSIYTGGLFGGAVTAVLINTPGAPSNVTTALEGFPMTLRGEAERALGLSLASSFIGGVLGCTALLFIAEPLAGFALNFGPGELFMVAFFGISVVGGLSADVFKSLFAGMFGLLIGTVGMSSTGVMRGTMGSMYLLDGLPIIPTLIGMLALPELYNLLLREYVGKNSGKVSLKALLHGIAETFRHKIRILWCSLVGIIVGIIPATGGAVASLLCYNQSKQWSKTPEKYGTGIPEGIVACETSNNASEGGSLATMLVLGIPGSSAAALILAALVIQGWSPGPKLFVEHREVIYTAISSLFLQQFVMLVMGALLCLLGARLIRIPIKYLVPCILVFAVLGAYSNRYQVFDCVLLILFSAIGWFMKKNKFPVMPVILGLLLGSTADAELSRCIQMYDSVGEFFSSPITIALAVVSLVCIAIPLVKNRGEE
ncbi:tripartite tricarboxylate transporter permease [Hominifimenecus sp. rT4P-3]|uniref:tripartite tricarboxylate transporter permease n=1 Tax=Hominifimenecus sp. rT4P-3 TaxID=3242979 RepID=UPI003DA57B2B